MTTLPIPSCNGFESASLSVSSVPDNNSGERGRERARPMVDNLADTAENGVRQGRRRKIVEESSDRMAFITGRLQSLPPSSSSLAYDHINIGVPTTTEWERDFPFPRSDNSKSSTNDAFNSEGSKSHQSEANADATQHPAADISTGQPLQKGTDPRESAHKPDPIIISQPLKIFTSKELSSCIISSESMRIVCSVLIALLVVLSYIDYPLLGINIVNSKSIVAAKPLYLLLLTDLTVVVAHLILKRRRGFENFDQDDSKLLKEDALNWTRAVKLLERGLVVHQTIRAVFIDCSIYVVIVVCGLSVL